MNQKINYFISFFTFIGYYVGLSLVISLGFIELSRYFSIPLRLLTTVIMIYAITKLRYESEIDNRKIYFLFWTFWIIYFAAIFKAMLGSATNFYKPPIEYGAYSIVYGIIPFLFFSLTNNDDTLNSFKNAIISSGFVLAILSYYLYGKILVAGVGRISMSKYMLGGDLDVISPLALSYASSLVIAICLYYNLFTEQSKKTILYYWGAIIVSMIPFFLGASRGGVVSLVLSITLIIFFRGSFKTKIRSLLFIIILGSAVVYFADYIQSTVILRILDTSERIEMGTSFESRIILWESAWSQFLSSPIWGDSVQSIVPPYPHNIILEVLMSVGIVGFIPFIMLLIIAFQKSIMIIIYRPEHVWVTILFFLGLIQNQFSGTIYSGIYFWAGMGLVFSVRMNEEENNLMTLLKWDLLNEKYIVKS